MLPRRNSILTARTTQLINSIFDETLEPNFSIALDLVDFTTQQNINLPW